MRFISCKNILVIGLGLFFLMQMPLRLANAQALVIAPQNVELGDRDRGKAIRLSNTADVARRYDISAVDMVMQENGTLAPAEDGFAYSAADMLRYAPRRLTLRPGEQRALRIMFRRKKGMADGAYHTHLKFKEVPLDDAAVTQDQGGAAPEAGGSAEFKVGVEYTISVPVVVSKGSVSSSLSLADARYLPKKGDDEESIEIRFERSGNGQGVGFVRGVFVDGDKEIGGAIEPMLVKVYRERDWISRKLAFVQAEGSDHPSNTVRLYLHDGGTADAPVLQVLDVPLPASNS